MYRFVCVQAGERSTSGAPPDFFRKPMKPCLPGGGAGELPTKSRPAEPASGLGSHLTVQDLQATSHFVRELVTVSLLPRLGERLVRLDAAVTAARRGLRNRLGRLWKAAADDVPKEK